MFLKPDGNRNRNKKNTIFYPRKFHLVVIFSGNNFNIIIMCTRAIVSIRFTHPRVRVLLDARKSIWWPCRHNMFNRSRSKYHNSKISCYGFYAWGAPSGDFSSSKCVLPDVEFFTFPSFVFTKHSLSTVPVPDGK